MKLPTTILFAGLLAHSSHAALYTSGHADLFGIGYEDGDFEPHIHLEGAVVDGTTIADAEYQPGEITTVVPQSTFDLVSGNGGRPTDSAWDAIGVAAGESYWFLPQSSSTSSTLGAPFAGVGTEELVGSDWTTDITIALVSVSGPGEFSMWQDGLSPSFAFSTVDGIDSTDILTVAAGSHAHYNWGFTEQGTYDITVEVSGTHVTDGDKSATATYQFLVVPEPSSSLLGLASGLILVLRRRR
ncbi:MAG: choice-of-anchor M domain-containing protein [Verrucomicrobiales bacterium]|nr:choice-of-anchor M domain-containing protein [Verrucomicrobiota bacterium JB025]